EEEVLHLPRDELLCLLLPGHQPVLVEDHLLALLPHLPGLGGHVLIDALSELARPRRRLEAGQVLLELDAVDEAGLCGCGLIGHVWMVALRNPKSQIPNPKSQIPNPKPNPRSQIPRPESSPNPKSRTKPGTHIFP